MLWAHNSQSWLSVFIPKKKKKTQNTQAWERIKGTRILLLLLFLKFTEKKKVKKENIYM